MTMTPSIRDLLKRATQSEHSEAESRLLGADGTLGSQEYCNFLKAMLEVHTVYGWSSAAVLCSESDQHREIDFIYALRRDLGMQGKFVCDDLLPTTMTRSFATGVRYAISGSSIGSTKILKQIAELPDVKSEYLTLSAFFCKNHLKTFFDNLNESLTDPEEAVSGAKSVFRLVGYSAQEQTTLSLRSEHSDQKGI